MKARKEWCGRAVGGKSQVESGRRVEGSVVIEDWGEIGVER